MIFSPSSSLILIIPLRISAYSILIICLFFSINIGLRCKEEIEAELAKLGHSMAATAIAQTAFNLSLAEAVQYVKDLED